MPDTITIGLADSGKVLEVRTGATVVLRLAENPTTGFRWDLAPVDAAILEFIGASFEPSAEPTFGSGGTREFRFAAHSPGRATVALKHRQAWEPDKPVDSFSVDIAVSP